MAWDHSRGHDRQLIIVFFWRMNGLLTLLRKKSVVFVPPLRASIDTFALKSPAMLLPSIPTFWNRIWFVIPRREASFDVLEWRPRPQASVILLLLLKVLTKETVCIFFLCRQCNALFSHFLFPPLLSI